MDKQSMEIYYYMGSHEKVYEWLVLEGANTKKQGEVILRKFFKNNSLDAEVVVPHLRLNSEKKIVDSRGFWGKVLSHFEINKIK